MIDKRRFSWASRELHAWWKFKTIMHILIRYWESLAVHLYLFEELFGSRYEPRLLWICLVRLLWTHLVGFLWIDLVWYLWLALKWNNRKRYTRLIWISLVTCCVQQIIHFWITYFVISHLNILHALLIKLIFKLIYSLLEHELLRIAIWINSLVIILRRTIWTVLLFIFL